MFISEYNNPIEQVGKSEGLGIFIDADCSIEHQRNALIMKRNRKCWWVLRTLISRNQALLRNLEGRKLGQRGLL